jgi:hypothetical protein
MFFSFDGIIHFLKEIEPTMVMVFFLSISLDFSIIDGFVKILNIYFFLVNHSITGNISNI